MSDRFTHKLLHPDKVSDLLAVHSVKVEDILTRARKHVEEHPQLAEAAKKAPLDELYVLRFILSEKSEKNDAFKHLIDTLEWRSQRLEALDNAVTGKLAKRETLMKYTHAAYVGLLGDLHPVFIVRAGRSSPKGLFTEITPDEVVEAQLMQHEKIFRISDARTRETGLLCKQVAIIDLEGFSMFNFDPKFSRVLGKASTLSATYYPQLLGKTILINMPTAFRVIYRTMSVFMPASTLEKQTICPANTLKKSAIECPFLKKFGNGVELMPPFLGGTGPMQPEFILPDKR